MALRRGLFVRKDSQAGTSPADARLALAGLLTANGSLSARPGVFPTPDEERLVVGTSGWAYIIASRHFAMSRGSSDGMTLATNDGPVSVSTSPAPQNGSRYDVVWVRHQDADAPWNDDSSSPEFGVTCGVEAATPSIPTDNSLPKGALRLANVVVKSGSTSTLDSKVTIDIVVPFTSTRGGRLVVRNQDERDRLTPLASPDNPIEVLRSDSGDMEWSTGNEWRSSSSASEFFSLGWDAPIQMSSAPVNALAGTKPPLSVAPVMQCGTVVGRTDSNSYLSITFPKPFEHCLYTFIGMIGDGGTGPGYIRLAAGSHWVPRTDWVVVQAVLPNGLGFANDLVRVNWIAIGA